MRNAVESDYQIGVKSVRALLGQRRTTDAALACVGLTERYPDALEPTLLLARIRQQQGRFKDMLGLAEAALRRDPAHRGAMLQFAEAAMFNGQHDRVLGQLKALEAEAGSDAELLQHVAQYYAHGGRHDDAHRCYQRAVQLEPDSAQTLYHLATSMVAIGNFDGAEELFSRVIELNPADYDAWQNRSGLRKQTDANNHIADLLTCLKAVRPGDAGEVPLNYALSKEHEDLGNFDQAFECLVRGADCRRRRMAYDVRHDTQLLDRLGALFDTQYAANSHCAEIRSGPIFIVGLPRSGTTLVDRIVSSHSCVESMGEINDLALTLTRLCDTSDKPSLLEMSARLDPDALGAGYLQSVNSYGRTAEFFTDKTPANFLYLGLIARALPGAKILHLRRHPVDSCLAMYRTLFRMGYPFSYNLDDLAEYYIAYDALMQHWHATFPGRIMDVSYEQLVDDQERMSRQIIQFCGLDWEAQCLRFDENAKPVATASAVQVRQPIYRDALARWRHYERQLSPLIQKLAEAGIEL